MIVWLIKETFDVGVMLTPLFTSYSGLIASNILRDVGIAALMSQRSTAACDILDDEKMTDSISLLVICFAFGGLFTVFTGGI